MTSTIHIPNGDELADRLAGVDRLLTARRWERAAIVFAFTDAREDRRPATPPKFSIKDFAALGFAGLASRTAVHRYRDAWIHAINNGWAGPVEPGDEVTLPEEEFPAWPKWGRYEVGELSGAAQTEGAEPEIDDAAEDAEEQSTAVPRQRLSGEVRGDYHRRSPQERLMHQLDSAANAVRRVAVAAATVRLTDPVREKALLRIGELDRWLQEALAVLNPPTRPEPEWVESVEEVEPAPSDPADADAQHEQVAEEVQA